MAKREEFDVCVIGTGAGGGVMVQELTAAGLKVVALQRGPFRQASDFDDDELETVVRDRRFASEVVETFRPDEEAPAVRGRFSQTAHGVGGTMTRWGAWAWRLRPDELKVLSTEGPIEGASLADWPLDYEELEPFYERAELDFGVAGEAGANPFASGPREKYPNPGHPHRVASQRVVKGAKTLGYHPFPLPVAINSRPYGRRSACSYGGNCHGYGCPVHAKATSLSVCIPRALATGRLDLRPNAVAHELRVGADGRVSSVRYLDWKRREQEVFARFFVLAGNAVGSAHLLLLSKSGSFPDGLANSSGLVGRNLTFHLTPRVGFLIDEPSMAWLGMSGHAAVDDLHPSDPVRGFVRGGVIAESNAVNAQPISYARLGTPPAGKGWGQDLKEMMRGFPRSVFLGAVLEDLPMESNRVDLDPEVKDAFGLPVPRITHGQHPNDLAQHEWFQKKMLEIAEAAGGKPSWLVDLPGVTRIDAKNPMRGGEDPLGTCRMGEDPERSVLDRWCRAHDVANLWVVDGSCFPTPGGYNPTLTILANAYRVAAHFVTAAKQGDPSKDS